MLLNAINVKKIYSNERNKVSILRKINLSIDNNEIVALMGPSGSGKTTLLNILGTLDTDYSGEIFIKNKNIKNVNNVSLLRSNDIGFVFQYHHLLPEFTILENLQIPRMIAHNDISKDEIMEVLEYLNIDNCSDRYPSEISGGERQRVAVLRALMNNPKLILADEPTGNLDRENSELLLKLICKLKHRYKQSFLIATHDLSVSSIADRVLYLKDGKIIEGKK